MEEKAIAFKKNTIKKIVYGSVRNYIPVFMNILSHNRCFIL